MSTLGAQFEKVNDRIDSASVRYYAFLRVFGTNVSRFRRFVVGVEWYGYRPDKPRGVGRQATEVESHRLYKAWERQMKTLCDTLGRVRMMQGLHVHVLPLMCKMPSWATSRPLPGERLRRDWLGLLRSLEELRNACL